MSTKEYVDYKRLHPEKFMDEPPKMVSGAFWTDVYQGSPSEETKDWVERAKVRWRDYHLKKAKMLGYKISIDELALSPDLNIWTLTI